MLEEGAVLVDTPSDQRSRGRSQVEFSDSWDQRHGYAVEVGIDCIDTKGVRTVKLRKSDTFFTMPGNVDFDVLEETLDDVSRDFIWEV